MSWINHLQKSMKRFANTPRVCGQIHQMKSELENISTFVTASNLGPGTAIRWTTVEAVAPGPLCESRHRAPRSSARAMTRKKTSQFAAPTLD
jgi:hypothetical protein